MEATKPVKTFFCGQCLQQKIHPADSISTGYGINKEGQKICFSCCGENDFKELENLKIGEKTIQYWDGKNVINWPSTMKITPTYTKKGKHNIAGVREDIYFQHKGLNFHAVQYGRDSQIAHIKRVK